MKSVNERYVVGLFVQRPKGVVANVVWFGEGVDSDEGLCVGNNIADCGLLVVHRQCGQ